MDELFAFANRVDLPVLVHTAIAHAQFETIHPFTDGNGRTGRAFIHALLRGKGLTRNVTVPVSAGLLADTDSYFATLTTYRDGDPEPIIWAAANASFKAMANARQLVGDLRRIREFWRQRIRARSHSAAWEVADLLIRQPVVNAKVLNEQLGIGPTHVRRHMDVPAAAGVVQLTKVHQRGVFWRAQEVLDVLDAFATTPASGPALTDQERIPRRPSLVLLRRLEDRLANGFANTSLATGGYDRTQPASAEHESVLGQAPRTPLEVLKIGRSAVRPRPWPPPNRRSDPL
jgi:hypothetical protein